jgi:hypothetical protein
MRKVDRMLRFANPYFFVMYMIKQARERRRRKRKLYKLKHDC